MIALKWVTRLQPSLFASAHYMKHFWLWLYKRPFVRGSSLIAMGTALVISGSIIASVVATQQLIQNLSQFQPAAAQRSLSTARIGARLCQIITFGQFGECRAWNAALATASHLIELEHELVAQATATGQSGQTDLKPLLPILPQLANSLDKLDQTLPAAPQTIKLLPPLIRQSLSELSGVASGMRTLATVLEQLSEGTQTWILVLQNSDELRATGGFPGSYLKLQLENGVITEYVVEDIYDADGQFTGNVPAPHGVLEYTSSNRGLRLPDANWEPDFPQSAQQMLQFFAASNRTAVSGLVAVNMSVGQAVLEATGPIELPDYNTTVTSSNLATVLRKERSEFFPGSIQKKHVIEQTVTAAKLRLAELSASQLRQLFQSLLTLANRKEIQAYAVEPELQAQFEEFSLSGKLPRTTFIMLLESNVGINKVNPFIARKVELAVQPSGELQLQVTFNNTAQKSDATTLTELLGERAVVSSLVPITGYANYQRILVPDGYELDTLEYAGEAVTEYYSERIQYADLKYRQIGMLLPVLPGETRVMRATFKPVDTAANLWGQTLQIIRQSGLPPTAYTVVTPTHTEEFVLEDDVSLELK